MIQKLIDWLRRRSAATESDTEYDGVFSYAGEFHAVVSGAAVGLAAGVSGSITLLAALAAVAFGLSAAQRLPRIGGRAVVKELRREPWYGFGGGSVTFVVGWIASGRPITTLVEAVTALA